MDEKKGPESGPDNHHRIVAFQTAGVRYDHEALAYHASARFLQALRRISQPSRARDRTGGKGSEGKAIVAAANLRASAGLDVDSAGAIPLGAIRSDPDAKKPRGPRLSRHAHAPPTWRRRMLDLCAGSDLSIGETGTALRAMRR
jgi:hypothetical protein